MTGNFSRVANCASFTVLARNSAMLISFTDWNRPDWSGAIKRVPVTVFCAPASAQPAANSFSY
jgi:hypothetical protein